MNIIILSFIIFFIALFMTLSGRGGGNFYLLALVLSGVSMHEAATTGQAILFVSSISATIIFKKSKNIEWKLVLFIGITTAVSAFFGGLLSQYFTGKILKFIFSFFLLISSFLMFKPVSKKTENNTQSFGIWNLKTQNNSYNIDLKITIPIIIITGFGSGMVGISGGSFLVPLMVLACNVPMNIAVATSTTMVAGTALMGFMGHLLSGHFVLDIVIPLSIFASIGGILGGFFAVKTKPKLLKYIFATTTLIASIIMVINGIN